MRDEAVLLAAEVEARERHKLNIGPSILLYALSDAQVQKDYFEVAKIGITALCREINPLTGEGASRVYQAIWRASDHILSRQQR